MRNKRNRKLMSILLTLSLLVTLLVPLVGPAAASATYATLSTPTVLNNDTRQDLGTVQIDIPTVTGAAYSTVLVTLPTDFKVDWSALANSPVLSLVKTGKTLAPFTAASFAAGNAAGNDGTHFWNNGIVYVSDREFKVTYLADNSDYDVRLLVTLPKILVPGSSDGDIKLTLQKLTGDVSDGSLVVGKSGSGAVSTYVNDTITMTNSGSAAREVELYLKENTRYALKQDTSDTAKFKLPKGMSWSTAGGESPVVTNLTSGVAEVEVTANVDPNDSRVLLVKRSALTDVKSIFKVAGTVKVDESEATLGNVDLAVSGTSSISPGTLSIGTYVDYGIKLVNAEDAKNVTAGRNAQDVGDFNIEEGAKGSILNSRSITLTLPEGTKWATLGNPSATGSLSVSGNIAKVGTDGRKVKFTALNTGGSKGKFKFENVQVDVAVDFTGDINVNVDGAGIDNQSLVIAKAPKVLTATADMPQVKIGMQNQAGGTIKIVEGDKEALINGKDLKVVAPSGVTWFKVPTVKVTAGDLTIDTNSITKSGSDLIIPIKSQSTKASTIEISDVFFTVDRTVPEGVVTVDVKGDAIDEINGKFAANTAVGTVGSGTSYTTNSDGLVFAGRDVAVSVDAAKTVTPAPGATKATAIFKIGDTKFTLNGVDQTMDAAPYLKNDRTYLPIRFVAKAVGVSDSNIIWNDADQSVVLIKDGSVVKLTIGSNIMLINGTPVTMDTAPEIVDPGRTMLPVSWVAKALNANITWDNATQTVTVN